MDTDPRKVVAQSKMSGAQILWVAILVCVEGIEGYDIASIALAAPGIASAWNIGPEELGVVLGAELIGMTVGSVVMGQIADWLGRRMTLISGLAIMAAGLIVATGATGIGVLLAGRLLTGFGIGGLLTSVATAISEHSNLKGRDLSFGLMGAGYSLMIVIASAIASGLMPIYGWRSVFGLGALLSLIFIALVWF